MSKIKIDREKYEVINGKDFRLSAHSCQPDEIISGADSKDIIEDNVKEISDFQERMYASSSRSALIVFQAMDAAGKDGTIERLVTGVNPQGVKVASFKAPTSLELRHDFLWRVQLKLPPRGMIGIFNRSHYEEVLVVKVHPSYLIPQNIPGIEKAEDATEELWQRRYAMIRNFEQNLVDTGTSVLKFFLNVSKPEQRDRIESRMNNPEKHWKFNLGDVKERTFWDAYMDAYEQAIRNTATPQSPWYVIPADDKDTMRAIVTTIAAKKLNEVKQDWPDASETVMQEIAEAQRLFKKEGI